ncbi:MAG: nuclear transport factor 2 family protein [Saprospiraceae bacterium]|nr:nuclear transport factor 2 family protein [Saprospiraceae bacterium]
MSPKELVIKWVDAFNQGDLETLISLYAEDAVNHQVANDPVVGKPAIIKMFEKEFDTADMMCIIENLYEDGDWAILEWKDPKGLRGCGFFRIVNGKIKLQRGYWDKLTFLKMHDLPIP